MNLAATHRRLIICAIVLLGIAAITLLAWPLLFLGPDDARTVMYVQTPASMEGPGFNQKLATILQRRGLHPKLGRSWEDPSKATYVLEARGIFTKIWSQNVLLDPQDAARCGYWVSRDDPITNDQRQYRISVQSVRFASVRARTLFVALKNELAQDGFEVSAQQLPCAKR